MTELPLSYNQRTRIATFYGADKWRRHPVTFALQWCGNADVSLLRQSLNLVVRRHTALRTYFPEADGPARCVPAADAETSLTTADLRTIPAVKLESEWRSQVLELQAPFDLSVPLLIRGKLFHLADSTMLGFAVDHTVFDGASAAVLLDDFSHVYNTLASGGEPADLDIVVSDFSRFAAAEQEWIGSAAGIAAWEYWKQPWQAFGPFPELPFPRVAEPATTYTWQRAFDVPGYAAFRRRAQELRVSPFVLVVSAINWTLRARFGKDVSAMVVMNSRRHTPESVKGVGNYATKLLIATDFKGLNRFEDCVGAARTRVIESIRHGMMPYELLTEKLWPDKAGIRPNSAYLTFDMATADKSYPLGDRIASVASPGTDDMYSGMSPALYLSVQPQPNGTAKLVAGYHHARFEPAVVDKFLEHMYAQMLS